MLSGVAPTNLIYCHLLSCRKKSFENFLAHTDPVFTKTGILKVFDLQGYYLPIYMCKEKNYFNFEYRSL